VTNLALMGWGCYMYSFGVLILEIISGKKNSNFYESDGAEDLLSYVSVNQIL
jgi:hypothetical protein